MPQGDKRGSTYEFYDYSYDGEWRGDGLYNGLGSLTDGDLGPADYKLSYYTKSKSEAGFFILHFMELKKNNYLKPHIYNTKKAMHLHY